MQTARGDIIGAVELTPSVKCGQNDLKSRNLLGWVLVDGNTSAIVRHRDRAPIAVQNDVDLGRVSIRGFINGVIHHFPKQMVEPRLARSADIHSRALTYRFQSLEDLNAFASVIFCTQNGRLA